MSPVVSPPRVLHVTNRFGGGLATCVTQYASATPELFHYLLCNEDPWAIRDLSTDAFAKVIRWDSSPLAAVRQLRKIVDEAGIDVVHAHSSTAGALARLARLPARVVYTPNGFAMLAPRNSTHWWAGQAERLLGLRRITIAGVGTAERGLARRLSPRSAVLPLVNTPHPGLRPCARFEVPMRVVMVGRLNAQKAPLFFAEVAATARARQLPFQFTWLGDGEQVYKDALAAAGVEVTGWLDMQEVHRRQGEANVYLHSGLYEGCSLSILDAAAQGLPSIGRPLPGIAEVPWMLHGTTVDETVDLLIGLMDKQTWVAAHWNALTKVQAFNDTVQRDQLYEAYGVEPARHGDGLLALGVAATREHRKHG
jgi:glycosyltransferase involved in cell wall biosynthesis